MHALKYKRNATIDDMDMDGKSPPRNKSRKLLHLTKKTIFPKVVVSYGGPQSNSMLAISKVVAAASSGQSTFFYFIKPLPKFLRNAPSGNLKAALALGMQVDSS